MVSSATITKEANGLKSLLHRHERALSGEDQALLWIIAFDLEGYAIMLKAREAKTFKA